MKNLILFFLSVMLLLHGNYIFTYAENVDASIDAIESKESEGLTNYSDDVLPEVIAPSAVLIDADSGIVIYEREKDARFFPASITKIMTALICIEYAQEDMEQRVPFSHNAVFSLPYGSSHIAMDEGETLSMDEALYGLMLESANEVANALAEYIGGDIDTFAAMMNLRAKELGAVNTHFTNPHGLHSDEHYTTSYDMALIMREAVKNPLFIKYISTKYHEIPPTEKQPLSRPLNNSNKLIQPGRYFYEYVVGGKTGYTDEARHTLVTYGKKDGRNLIAVTLGDEKGAIYTDAILMYEYGFGQFKEMVLFDKNSFHKELMVTQNNHGELHDIGKSSVTATESIKLTLPINSEGKLEQVVELPLNLTAPVSAGDKVGRILIKHSDQDLLLGEVSLVAMDTVSPVVFDDPQIEEPETDTEHISALSFVLTIIAILVIAGTAFSLLIVLPIYNRRRKMLYSTTREYRFRDSRYN